MKKTMLAKEDGSILIVALILLVLLTLMGISATTLTDIELQIAGNELVSRANFYNAEAAAMENIQLLANTGEAIKDPTNPSMPWLNLPSELPADNDITDQRNWTDANSRVSNNANNGDQRFLTVFEGVIAGDSLDMTRSRIYTYRVVGKGEINPGQGMDIVEMGFRMPF
jgi:type IV pilus assembly protein PilX